MSNDLKSRNLGWGERLAIIDFFNLTDVQAMDAFEASQDEIDMVREMVKAGSLSIPSGIKFGKYMTQVARIKAKSIHEFTAPITASKPPKTYKKRGPKGTKIRKAFDAITTTPVYAKEIAEKFDISMNILKQGKRFDETGLGKVHVKKDKKTQQYMIWRDKI